MSSSVDHHHHHRPTQLGRADSSATGSSAYTQTTRSSSSAPTNYALNSPSTPATTAESASQSPIKGSHLPPQSALKQQTHPAAPTMPPQPSQDPQQDEPHSPWKLEFKGVVKLVRWVKGNGGSESNNTGTRKQQQQRSSAATRPFRSKKPLAPIQTPSSTIPSDALNSAHGLSFSPPLPSPVNHRRTTFEIVSPVLPAETGQVASPVAGTHPSTINNVTASSMTLPQLNFSTRGLSLIEALDVPTSTSPPTILDVPQSIITPSTLLPSQKNGNAQGTFHNNVNEGLSITATATSARASTPSTVSAEAGSEAPSASGAPRPSSSSGSPPSAISQAHRTSSLIVLNSDSSSASGSASSNVTLPAAASSTSTARAPRAKPPQTKSTPTPSDEDDVFFTASSGSRASSTHNQQPFPSRRSHTLSDEVGYIANPSDDDEEDDEYGYDSPRVWRRMSSAMDRVHARRERRRLGLSRFKNSDGEEEEDEDDDVENPDEDVTIKLPTPENGNGIGMTAGSVTSAASASERVVSVQFQEAVFPSRPTTTSTTEARQTRPRPPRPLPPIPIVGLTHVQLSTTEHSDDEDCGDERKGTGLLLSPNNVVSLSNPTSTGFPHAQGTLNTTTTTNTVGTRPNRSPVSASSDARFSVLSAEWVKVDSDFEVPASATGMSFWGKKAHSEAGHGAATTGTTSNNRFLFPFFSSSPDDGEEEDGESSSLHTSAVDHRFLPAGFAVSDVGHGVGEQKEAFLVRSRSARFARRISMSRSEGGHSTRRVVSKKAIITGEQPAVRRKPSGMALKDRLKKVFNGGNEAGKEKEKEKQQQQRPQTPVREVVQLEDTATPTASTKATRRKSVLVKKRPAEGLEKGNPKSRSTTSLGKEKEKETTPRPSMTKPENVPLPGSPASGTVEGSPVSSANKKQLRRNSSITASAAASLNRRFTSKFTKRRAVGGSVGSSTELPATGAFSDVGHGRAVSEVGHGSRRGSMSVVGSDAGSSGRFTMGGFFGGLSMTSLVSTPSSSRILTSPPKAGKLTKRNPMTAQAAATWSPSYGLGRGHSTSSSTFFGGGSATTPASILNVTAPPTPESPYVGLSDSPVVPLRSLSPSPLSTVATPRRSSTSLLFSTPKALRRISEVPRSASVASVVLDNATSVEGLAVVGEDGPDVSPNWVRIKPRRSVPSFVPEDDGEIPPVPPIPAALASQILVPAPPPMIPGRRPLPPPPPLILNPDSVHKKAPLVQLAYTGKQGYYAHEEARLQLQREIAEEENETAASTTAHGEDLEPQNPDVTVEYPLTPRLKESILRAHLYTSPSSPTTKLTNARMGSMYGFPRTEPPDDDLVIFKPVRPHLPHRPSSASAKRWTLAVNQIPDDSEFLKEIDDLRKSRQEIATSSRRASFRKTVEGEIAEDEPYSDGEYDDGSDEEGVWMKARRAMLTVREMMRTETSYRNHLIRLWEADCANPNPATPPTFLAHLPYLISASTLLSSRLEEDPSAWGVSAAFLGAEDALEKAFVAWCGVVGQVMLELAGNTPPISTSASKTSLYNRKSSTGPRDVLDKEKPVPKRADTTTSSASGGSGSGSGKTSKKSKSTPRSSIGSSLPTPLSAGSKPLSVQDIAIMPSQRVPRYVLLFKDLLEQTPATSPSRALVERALQGAMRIAKNCDEAQQHAALTIPSP